MTQSNTSLLLFYYVQDWIDQHSVMCQLMGVTIHQTSQNFSSRHNWERQTCPWHEAFVWFWLSLKPEKQREWRSVVWSLNTLQVKLSPCLPPWSSRLRKPSLHTGRISPNRQTSEQIWMGWGWSWVCESGSLGGKGQINIRQIISEEKLIYRSHVQLSFQSDWHWPVNSKSPKINLSDYLWC